MTPTPPVTPALTHTTGLSPADATLATELVAYPDGTREHLVGTLMGYWGRERRADTIDKLRLLGAKSSTLRDDPAALTGLVFESLEPAQGRGAPLAIFSFPEQNVGRDLTSARGVFVSAGPSHHAPGSIAHLDVENRTVTLRWTPALAAEGVYPTRLVADDWVNPAPKPAVLASLARTLAAGGTLNPVTLDLLDAAAPRFHPGAGPTGGLFSDDLSDALAWVTELDSSYVAVQGPPGAGKTYTGAHLVYALIKAGRRVGITAMSHSAVENLLEAVHALFSERDDLDALHAAKKVSSEVTHGLAGVAYPLKNAECASPAYNLVAGTTWLFASDAILASPVDCLVIDEAGQLSLADAVVASLAATNVLLLGDPAQLAQVALASHPGAAGSSVLTHVLDGELITADRGVFLGLTRRMHPVITEYISSRFYDGRLGAHDSCALQDIDSGIGLRFRPVTSIGRTTSSPEEANVIRDEILGLIGRDWTNPTGVVRALEPDDFMVVAPFNDQVDLLRETLDTAGLADVPVGTVDKFQGREAPVVFFSMTTSSPAQLTRGVEFLFSPNRLNVAISRARCAAYLVANPDLLAPDLDPAADLLIDHVRAFVAAAT